MKRLTILFTILIIVFAVIPLSWAILIDRGGGLIYDDDLNITWLQDANYADTRGYDDLLYSIDTDGTMYWDDAVTWANNLSYQGYDDWRLPYNPDICQSHGCSASEMGHLYHIEGISATTPGILLNVRPGGYWAGNERSPGEPYWFGFADGGQGVDIQNPRFYAWAVRDGNSKPVPEPNTMLLLSSGFVGLVIWRSLKRFR